MKLNFDQQKYAPLYCPSYTDNVFSVDEIKEIHNFVSQIPEQKARVGMIGGDSDEYTRRSKVKWIEPSSVPDWMQQKIVYAFQSINNEHFKFHLTGAESFQYTIYDSQEEGEYKWHSDTSRVNDEIRKLSMSMLLSNPDDFVGGNLICAPNGNPIVLKEKLGRAIFFPSWVPHCVTPVTQGTRTSLVIWAHGPMFK